LGERRNVLGSSDCLAEPFLVVFGMTAPLGSLAAPLPEKGGMITSRGTA
jgi:hypothetical protein